MAAGSSLGCESGVKVAEMGESVRSGDTEVTVEEYEIRHLEVIEGKRTHEYDEPVLAVRVTFKNNGESPFRYSPTHDSQQMTEETTPLLYADPGEEASLPPEDKNPINGVVLEEGFLEEQVTKSKSVEPGSSLTDLILFEVPADEQADLIFSVPPSMHDGEAPLLFRIPYQYQEPKGPKWHKMGGAAELDGVEFKVTSASTEYVKLKDGSDGEAYSSEPQLKISYKIKNNSEEAVKYSPGHQAVSGRRGAVVLADGETVGRVKFSSNASVEDQLRDSTKIEPGKEIEDFTVFVQPDEEVETLKFEYPASRFGRSGLVRFEIPYEYETPEKPEPIKEEED